MSQLISNQYVFRKYKDKYFLKNVIDNNVTIITYTLTFLNCSTNLIETVQQGSINPNEEISFNLLSNGDYTLIINGLSKETICINHYLNLIYQVIKEIELVVCNDCDCGCNNNDCTPKEAKDCLKYQNLFNYLSALKFLINPISTNCIDSTIIYDFISKATKYYKCDILKDFCNQNFSTSLGEEAVFNSRIFKIVAVINYLAFYYYELNSTVDEEEKLFISNKYKYSIISSCITKLGINIETLSTIFNNLLNNNNTPPLVDDYIINLDPEIDGDTYNFDYDFNVIDFTSNFQDLQNDNPNTVLIEFIPVTGSLTFNGNIVEEGFSFPYNQAGNLKYSNSITSIQLPSLPFKDVLLFKISDNNTNSLFSIIHKISISLNELANLPPTCVKEVNFDITVNQPLTLTPNEFLTSFNDPEGDTIKEIRITLQDLNPLIKLYNRGIEITSNTIIPFSDIENGYITAEVVDSNTSDTTYDFTYEASDTGSGIFVGTCNN